MQKTFKNVNKFLKNKYKNFLIHCLKYYFRQYFFKQKINKWDLLKKILHSKGNHKQKEKTALKIDI